ncbi:HypC/HybG/HupF family hydrogenase formation chaperone [uncultured Eubacterium sp.]|mgnify:FL=1|uniref:HypC/HybG/HupF family hydrogenase formation chaperone n=1 Tax=uncultured Eubacterium sp. TaxID=165185 RepID=UPI0025CD620F|nr:HypC/HybG/HupF family hydrogenase formation chaperone [uncultured Eubacterium sp.]
MCVAAPGKIIEIDGNFAKIDYSSNITTVNKGIVDCKVGDWVLVHAGLIIQVLPENEAEYMVDLFKELEELGQ